jgi:ring-1,2-phenylacetyl-CoA epoxidase subunit PaaE
MSQAVDLTVSKKRALTPNSVELSFTVPDDLKANFSFKAGQYLTLSQEINGAEVRRSYSLCSAPHQNQWRVGIKKVDNGVFSSWAHDQLQQGDTLKVFAPEGNFTLQTSAQDQKHYLAFAAGSGITPIMGMIQEVLSQAPESKFTLVYGNQSPQQTMFLEELNALAQAHPGRLNMILFYSRAAEPGARFGRIEASTIKHLFQNELSGTPYDDYFLCGPEQMIQTLKELLPQQGAKAENIHDELFFSAPVVATEVKEGQCALTIVLDGESTLLHIDKNTPVLDAALDHDLDPPYSCQGGICSSCIARVTSGQAQMIKNQILTDGEVAEGLVLTCQALAQSDELTVDYDEA